MGVTTTAGEAQSGASVAEPKRNLALTLAGNLGILALTVATGMLNARLLGPSGRGELAAIQTIPSMIGTIAFLGLPSAVAYFSARRPDETRMFASTALVLCLLVSIPAAALGYAFMPRLLGGQSREAVDGARLYLAFIPLQAVVIMPYLALQGLGKFGVWNLLRLAPNIASLLAIAVASATGAATAERFSGWYLIAYAMIGPVAYLAFWGSSTGSRRPSVKPVGDLLRYGLPSALMIPAGMVNLQMDQMLMAAWLPSKVLGLYAVSVSWTSMLSAVFGALGPVLFPALAATRDPEAQRALVARSFRLGIIAVLVLAGGLALVTPVLLPLFFGREFAPAVPAALILVGASIVLNLDNLAAEILRGLGAPRWPLFGQVAALPVTIVLLVVLLPRWTIVGASVASLIAYAVTGIVCVGGIARICQIPLRELLLPTAADVRTLWNVALRTVRRMRPAR
jgi:O-antigen/teichoic acid export membrane protein